MTKAWYYLLLLTACLIGCTAEDDPIIMNEQAPTTEVDTTVSYLALGDSYTIGTSVREEERWPRQLARALRERERIGVQPLEIVARNGWRTDNLSNALSDDPPPSGPYDLVSLLIGVNDQYQGFAVSGYMERFEDLLQRAIALAASDTTAVFVVSIPDYAFTPFGGGREAVSREIDAFNRAARTVTERYGVPFYDITPISRRGLAEPNLVASDRLHPSARQYRLWVDEVLLGQVATQLRRSR